MTDAAKFAVTFGVGLAVVVGAVVIFSRQPGAQSTVTQALQPTNTQPALTVEQPVASVSWDSVNTGDGHDAAYWERDRKAREEKIASDLAQKQAIASQLNAQQAARQKEQDRQAKIELELMRIRERQDSHSTVQRVR